MGKIKKEPWYKVILKLMEELIPQIQSFADAEKNLRVLGTILISSNLNKEETEDIAIEIAFLSAKISRDNVNEKSAFYFLVGLIEEL